MPRERKQAPKPEPASIAEPLPEKIPDAIEQFPAAILARLRPLQQFEGIPLKLLTPDDLDACTEALKRSYDVRSKDGKTPELALSWMRALVATLTLLRAKAGTAEAMDRFAEKSKEPA